MSEADAEAFSILVWRQRSVKTSDFFLRDFTRATTPATHLGIIFPPSLTHSPLLSSILPPLLCVSKPFRLSLDHALTSNADGSVILLTCHPISTSSTTPLSFSMELSVSCQQSRLHFRFFFTIHSQHLRLDWDLDSSRRFSNSSCPL